MRKNNLFVPFSMRILLYQLFLVAICISVNAKEITNAFGAIFETRPSAIDYKKIANTENSYRLLIKRRTFRKFDNIRVWTNSNNEIYKIQATYTPKNEIERTEEYQIVKRVIEKKYKKRFATPTSDHTPTSIMIGKTQISLTKNDLKSNIKIIYTRMQEKIEPKIDQERIEKEIQNENGEFL